MRGGYALDPSKPLSLYVHSQWGKDKGLIGETIYAICQSSDGFLWVGTDRGLVRFDGERFTLIQRPLADQPVVGPVRGLVEDSEGNLWIRPQATQMLLYRDGRFKTAFANAGLPFSVVTAMARDGSGGVLLSELISHTLRYVHGKFETVANSTEAVGTVTSVAETRDSRIWLGTRDDGLFVIKEGNPGAVAGANLENDKINALVAANNGGLWIGTDEGLRFRSTRGDVTFSPPEWNNKIQIFDLTNDIDGNLWAASSRGLIRVGSGGDFSVIPGDGKKTLKVTAVYADRDGNIWFGGSNGLERLQDGLFTTYSPRNGFP